MTALNDLLYRLAHGDPEMIAAGIGIMLVLVILLLFDKLINGDTENNWRRHDDR